MKFESFVCGGLSWQLFKSPKKDLAELAEVLSECRRLHLQLSTGYDERRDFMGSELRQCRRYLQNGRVRDLVSKAKCLQSLEIHFDNGDQGFAVNYITSLVILNGPA